MSGTPPGWYPDGQGSVRWWDGDAWTNHTHGPTPDVDRPVPTPGGTQPSSPGSRSPLPRGAIIAIVVLGFVASLIIGGLVLLGGRDDESPVAGPSTTEPGELSTTLATDSTEPSGSSSPSEPATSSEPPTEPTSSSPKPEPVPDPGDTVADYLTAIQDQDCDGLLAVVGAPLKSRYRDCESVLTPEQADFTYRIVSTRTAGETAVVRIDSLFYPGRADGGQRLRFTAETTLTDGAWLVTQVTI